MTSEVHITTGARLHFGLLSNNPSAGRQFGGAGLMIDSPGYRITARRVDEEGEDVAVGPVESAQRALRFIEAYRHSWAADRQPPPCRIQIDEAIPEHIGLGSGTQLGMAVAKALSVLAGEESADPVTLARRVGRGRRSALGIHGFGLGGFLVEGGKTEPDAVGALVARVEFPAHWRVVLMTPGSAAQHGVGFQPAREEQPANVLGDSGSLHGQAGSRPYVGADGTRSVPATVAGLSGAAELDAFARLAPMPVRTTRRLCAIVLMELLPAVVEADFDACGEALFEFGRLVGDYFAPVQGGTYASPMMAELVEHLRRRGVRGVGQTSWGPTLFALCADERAAEELQADVLRDPRWCDFQLHIAAPLNEGAVICSAKFRGP